MISSYLNELRYTHFDDIDLDSAERLVAHRELIHSKPILKGVYTDFYKTFDPFLDRREGGIHIELGSGWSFLNELIPNLRQTDIAHVPGISAQLDALQLPFSDGSVNSIFMTNTLHHLCDADRFFNEVNRVLCPGGRFFMVEPHCTPWTRKIWSVFHHEDYSLEGPWSFESHGPLSSANLAMTWIVFSRDRKQFEQRYPELKLISRTSHTGFAYLLSGGLSARSIVPDWTYVALRELDRTLSAFSKGFFDFFETVVLEKQR